MRNLSLGPILTILWAQDIEKEIPLLIIGFIYKEIISFNPHSSPVINSQAMDQYLIS